MTVLNRFTAAAAGLFALGLALVALSVLRGEGSAGIAICVPFFWGTGLFSSLGVLCFFGGMVLLFLGLLRGPWELAGPDGTGPAPGSGGAPDGTDAAPESPGGPPEGSASAIAHSARAPAPRARAGGVVLIGPVPIVFGSDPGISRTMFYMALSLMAALLVALLALALL
ncbi:MAG: DUF131 domain-containing protein [Euryarchaeota archaeon]|nr:DUF131 domain-containing protein [Euryarchaeota archaeon]